MGAIARRIVRFGRDHKTHLYHAACVCLIVAAAGLRFHGLSEKSLRHDEAAAANISSGALSEVILNTRCCNSSPILYPLLLYAVQKVESTPFSVRMVPATASVLTVALMLFWLPRLGVARGTAFLAALLATLSIEAIRHAQDAREYSVDALLAVVMIAGLLRYLRDGGKAPLCASLFLAPLLQYGLVLFGVAVMGAAMVLPRATLVVPEWNSYPSRIRNWLKPRTALLWPAACFLAGCAISYVVTVRYQWQEGGWHGLDRWYFQGESDASGVLGSVASRTWELMSYHMPQAVAIPVVGALALMLMASLKRRRLDAIATLALLAVGIAIFAAMLALYPFGGIRQNLYLGPVIFLAAGVAIHWTADSLASLTRRAWLARALVAGIACAIALAGMGAMRQDSPYGTLENITSVLAVLKERVREGDMVYAGWGAVPAIRFYQGKEEGPANYHYGTSWCTASFELCFGEMADLAYRADRRGIANNRIWFVTYQEPKVLENDMPGLSVEPVVFDVKPYLYLIEDTESLIKIANANATDTWKNIKPSLLGKPLIRSTFDVYLSEDMLIYVKEPCDVEDVQETFLLHVFPADANDLPGHRKQYGNNNLDFRFYNYGVWSPERCFALRELPDYDLAGIRTGQYTDEGRLWEGEHNFDE